MFKRTISKCTEEVQGLVVKVWINENGTRRLTVTKYCRKAPSFSCGDIRQLF